MNPLTMITAGALIVWCSCASDAVAEPAREVPLVDLLSHAERHAPRLELARRQRGRADAARADAEVFLHDDPTLSVAAGPRFSGDHASALDLSASLAQPIELAGEPGLRRAIATRAEERALAELAGARQSLALEVRLAYQSARAARARLELSDRVAAFAQRTLEVARRRLAAGDATRIDVLVAESGHARARSTLLESERRLADARTDLAALTGWPLREPPLVPSGLEPPAPAPSLEGALSRALGRHTPLEARRAAAAEARARLALAERQAVPAPTVGVSVMREGSVGSPANTIVLGSVALPLPLWSGNRQARARDRAEAEIAGGEVALATRELEALVIHAHRALVSAAARAELLQGAGAAALEASLSLIERGFEHGELSALEVAEAEERLAAAQLDALDALAEYHRARAELDYLVGEELGAAPLASREPGGPGSAGAGGAP